MRFAVLILLAACGSTGQREVTYPAFGAGRATAPFAAGAWQVTLDVAQVGVGPFYFCATAAASSDLCPVAVAELAAAATVDALDAAPQPLGEVYGTTGAIRSATYDFAVTWLPTQTRPTPASRAPGGHSAHFEGRATKEGITIRFVADVDVLPRIQGSRAVEAAPAQADVDSDAFRFDVRLDAAAWWRAVDFDALAAQGGDPVVVARHTQAYNALVIGMTASAPPVLSWSPRAGKEVR